MNVSCRLISALMIGSWLLMSAAHADEVVLLSGERFTSEKVWEEKGKIRFNMHGLVVSVHKSDVASIVRNDGTQRPLTPPPPANHPLPQTRPQPTPQAPKLSSNQAKQAVPGETRTPKKVSNKKDKLKGIGFEGISWHMRPTDLPGLSKIGTEQVYGGVDQYWQPDGPLSLGNVLLDGLVFGFWQNRLYTIMIWVDGKPGYQRLKKVVFDRYGTGQAGKNSPDRFVWVRDETTDRLLEFDEERNIGVFWMRSRDLDSHIKQQFQESTSG